jgi:tRNA(Ile)-lysidine synthase
MNPNIQGLLSDFFKKQSAPLYLVAVSGGLDSMCLLWNLNSLNLPLHVLHVNYNLRGTESIEDANLVQDYCKKIGVPLTIHAVNFKEFLKKNGGNLQQEARNTRYAFFNEISEKYPKSKVVLAHHFDDQMETFWLQLFRQAGMSGLSGMKAVNDRYLRPFLSLRKEELKTLAKTNKIPWREDISNAKNDYSRNRWRNEYLPFLNAKIPTLSASVNLIQDIFQKHLETDKIQNDKWRKKILKTSKFTLNEINQIPIYQLVEIFKLLEIPLYNLPAILALVNSQKGSKRSWTSLSGPYNSVIREDNSLVFLNTNTKKFKLPSIEICEVIEVPKNFNKNTFYLNPEKISGKISLRKWEIGDRIHAIGLKGSKLISDVLTSAKVPNLEREQQLVLVDEEKIIACPGFCIDRRAVSKTGDQEIIQVKIK